MRGRNQWEIIGNVVADPELRYTGSEIPVTNVRVAVNSQWKDKDGNKKEHVEYIYVVIWNKLAEVAAQYLKKGKPVFFAGKSRTSSYEHEGVTKYKTELVADEMILLGSAPSSSESGEPEYATPPAGSRTDKEDLPF